MGWMGGGLDGVEEGVDGVVCVGQWVGWGGVDRVV